MGLFNRKQLSSFTDEQLIGEIERGNTAAFNLLYERYSTRLYQYLFRILYPDAAQAEDFLQELFLKVLNNTHSFNAAQKASTWLYTIATNLCRNKWRNEANRERLMKSFKPWEHYTSKTVQEKLQEQYRNKVLHELLQTLENEECVILQLRFNEELTIREIAIVTGIAEGTIKSRIFYLLKKMASKLKSNSIEL